MMIPTYERALIICVGYGLSASVARTFAAVGMRMGLAARNADKLRPLAHELGAATHGCDVSDPEQVEALFAAMDEALDGPPDVVVYNPSARVGGALVELNPAGVASALAVSAYGGFLVAQAPATRMLPAGHGAILFTGASASVKGYPLPAPFAMGKFAPERVSAFGEHSGGYEGPQLGPCDRSRRQRTKVRSRAASIRA